MTPIDKALEESVSFLFYIVSYVIMRNKEQERMIKEQMKKH